MSSVVSPSDAQPDPVAGLAQDIGGSPAGIASDGAADEYIRIRGARVHNLQNVDLDIPRGKFVVLTGPSGSGKSSLAFDTLFAEGQRQYIESLSVFARQFVHQLERPDVDAIEGLQPTVCIDQRPAMANPRSTVATVTEIYDYLRLLMARLGEVHCPQCDAPIRQLAPEQIQELLLALPEGSKAMLMAPLVRGRKGSHVETLAKIRKAGFVRVRVDGEVYELDHLPELDARKNHTLEAVVDRIVVRPGQEARLAESIKSALLHGEGRLIVCRQQPESQGQKLWRDDLYSTRYACPDCNVSLAEVEPRTFSFNSPYGACPECEGLGVRERFDPDLVMPEREKSFAAGAIAAWRGLPPAAERKIRAAVEPYLLSKGATWETPLGEMSAALVEKLWHGDGKKFAGVQILLEKEYATATESARQEILATFRGNVPCPACGGSRLRPEARSVRLAGKAIHQITSMTVVEARQFFAGWQWEAHEQPIGEPLVTEMLRRLIFLDKVGVPYLSLDRAADTLSGGELQRVRLATGIGSGLVGVCYVLDEPSIGLHQRDNDRLLEALRELQQLGNTVLVVEHDEAAMRQADWLVDMGPGAGQRGGRIVDQGPPTEVAARGRGLTGQYLSGQVRIAPPEQRRRLAKSRSISLEGATLHNLRDIDVRIPLGALTCVTGVSGSGKSSLINETLAHALVRRLGGLAPKPGPHRALRGVSQLDKIVPVDQSPIGRSPRSNAATYTGVFDEIRKVFAATREAKARGFGASRFSFNTKGGRCEECQGQGFKRIEMNFLPDLFVECEACRGARFNEQTLAVKYRGRNIAEILDLCVDDAVGFFENFSVIHRLLVALQDVGLGYLPLGQPSTTISGGEAQRIKLAAELGRAATGHTLYLLDEPTTGLHFDDIRRLLDVLQKLVDRGNSVLVIEHNLDVIRCADWIIDLGPEGGGGGGQLVAMGTPEEVAAIDASHTGRYLKAMLSTSSP